MVRFTRRELRVASGGLVLASAALPLSLRAEDSGADDAAQSSPLIYVSPLRSDGSESRCHAEVWFVTDGDDLLIVTPTDRWRARAIERGLTRARVWIGDHGVWTVSEERFRHSPRIDVSAGFERDAEKQSAALRSFGAKYPEQWDRWGPRFRQGLDEGSRVLIRYRPTTAG